MHTVPYQILMSILLLLPYRTHIRIITENTQHGVYRSSLSSSINEQLLLLLPADGGCVYYSRGGGGRANDELLFFFLDGDAAVFPEAALSRIGANSCASMFCTAILGSDLYFMRWPCRSAADSGSPDPDTLPAKTFANSRVSSFVDPEADAVLDNDLLSDGAVSCGSLTVPPLP